MTRAPMLGTSHSESRLLAFLPRARARAASRQHFTARLLCPARLDIDVHARAYTREKHVYLRYRSIGVPRLAAESALAESTTVEISGYPIPGGAPNRYTVRNRLLFRPFCPTTWNLSRINSCTPFPSLLPPLSLSFVSFFYRLIVLH